MKSHANKIKFNELFSLLNAVDLGGHSNSLENEWTYKLDAILTKLGGKTYIKLSRVEVILT